MGGVSGLAVIAVVMATAAPAAAVPVARRRAAGGVGSGGGGGGKVTFKWQAGRQLRKARAVRAATGRQREQGAASAAV